MKCNPNASLHISLLPPPPPIDVGYGSSWNTTSRVCKKYREMYNLCSLRLIIQYIFFSHCLFFPVKKASSYLSGWHSTVQYVKHAFINLLSVCILLPLLKLHHVALKLSKTCFCKKIDYKTLYLHICIFFM